MDFRPYITERIVQIIKNNKEEIKKRLEKNSQDLHIITSNLDEVNLEIKEQELLDGNLLDEELISFTDKGISLLYISPKIFEELKKLIPKDVEKMIAPITMIRLNSKMSDFPSLREIVSCEYFESLDLKQELDKINKLHIPTEEGVGDFFKKNYIINYSFLEKMNLNMVDIYDRRDASDSFLYSNKISFNMESEMVIKSIKFTSHKIEEIIPILEWLKNENYEVRETILELENKTIDNISMIEDYLDDFNIVIDYSESEKVSYEDFAAMRATIDWYKEIITSSILSPFEILIFAYDILKTFNYSEGENLSDSRLIPNIIKTGKIVCVGYSKLLERILNELGIRTVSCTIPPIKPKEEGHQRVIVRIDDDKYDIHGVFAVDPTWDRGIDELSLVQDKNENCVIRRYGRDATDKIIKEYDALTLYNYFLIPFLDYEKVFPKEEIPSVFKVMEEDKYFYNIWDVVEYDLKDIFNIIDKKRIKEYLLNSKKPDLKIFRKALKVVRRAEGYIEEDLDQVVNDTIELNQMLDENSLFFREDNINKK